MLLDMYERVLLKYPEGIGNKKIIDLIEEVKSSANLNNNDKNNEIYKKSK